MKIRFCVSIVVLVSCLCGHSPTATADPPPTTYDDAVDTFPHRRDTMVRHVIQNFYFKHDMRFPTWDISGGRTSVSAVEAILWVLSHPSDFRNNSDDVYYTLQKAFNYGDQWSPTAYLSTRAAWVAIIEAQLDTAWLAQKDHCKDIVIGTMCDYDFTLVDIAQLIYIYKEGDEQLTDKVFDPADPAFIVHPLGPLTKWTYADFLTNEMIFNLVCQRGGPGRARDCKHMTAPAVPFAFGSETDYNVFTQVVRNVVPHLEQPETENHVLGIVAWDYLITNWVMWQGGLQQGSSRRYYPDMLHLAADMSGEFVAKRDFIYKRVLKVVGRVMHSGMFEQNARPYGRVSLNALLALANYADAVTVDTGMYYSVRIRLDRSRNRLRGR